MGINRAIVTSLSDFADWLSENACPDIFKSVTYDGETTTMTATDADDHTVLTIKHGSGGFFRAYSSSGVYTGFALTAFPNAQNNNIEISGCKNGIIVTAPVTNSSGGRTLPFLISKTNLEKVAVIFPSSLNSTGANNFKQGIAHVAWGDSDTVKTTTTITPEAGNQTVMCVWGTDAEDGVASYTPNAFWMPAHSAYTGALGKFILNETDTFITNGYWAVKVEEETS